MVGKTAAVLALLLAAAANIAVAEGDEGPMMRPADEPPGMIGFGMMGGLRTIVALVDANSDGALSLEEVEAASVRIFKAADADTDGRLTTEEIDAFINGGIGPAAE